MKKRTTDEDPHHSDHTAAGLGRHREERRGEKKMRNRRAGHLRYFLNLFNNKKVIF